MGKEAQIGSTVHVLWTEEHLAISAQLLELSIDALSKIWVNVSLLFVFDRFQELIEGAVGHSLISRERG
jgi:hypothetical protein